MVTDPLGGGEWVGVWWEAKNLGFSLPGGTVIIMKIPSILLCEGF